MEKLKSETPLDYAVFQLSPKRSRCELIISSAGKKEKLASGLIKPFIAHLKVAEEQVASAAQSVSLEVGKNEKADAWFTKGTLERFVRFVSTPEVLELVKTYETEMSQLEAARRIYSQGAGDVSGGGGCGLTATDDATKKELLRAIDVRLVQVQQDLSTACARAVAAGFDIDAVSELQIFADRFGAHRLHEGCGKFISLCERRPDLINPWKTGPGDRDVRSSYGSNMSIDDDLPSLPTNQESIMRQQPNPPSMSLYLLHSSSINRESSVERDDGNKPNNTIPEKDGKDGTSTTTESISLSQSGRRLSVQDRINMFESKQKETTGSKPVVTKSVELRRMSSDVSAAERAVLRRWSGASDMSIDLSAEKKDVDSPLCTPSSAAVSQEKTVLNSNVYTAKSSSIVRPGMNIIPSFGLVSDGELKCGASNKPEQFLESSKLTESDGLKDQGGDKMQFKSFINRNEKQDNSEEKFNTLPCGRNEGVTGFSDKGKPKRSPSCGELSGSLMYIASEKDQGSSMTQTKSSDSKGGRQVEISNQRADSVSMEESIMQTRSRTARKAVEESGASEGVAGSRIREAFTARFKGIDSNSLSAQQEVRSVEKTEVVVSKESHSSEEVLSGFVVDGEHTGSQRMKFSRQGSATDLSMKAQVQQNESSFSRNNRAPFTVNIKSEAQESFNSFSTPPPEQAKNFRQTKGNQELNDELKFKANELEKLFAEHKLRVPGDQSNSVREGKPGDTRREAASSLQCSKAVEDASAPLFDYYQSAEPTASSKNRTKLNVSSLVKTVDNQDFSATLNKSFSDLTVSEGSRGKFYDKYMQKRDAKLREEWISNREEKEARLKSMQDSLNRSRSEMKAKFSGSADGQDSVSSVRRRAERLRSYNSMSIMKREQQRLEFVDSEDDEEAMDYLEQNRLREDRALDDTSFADGISRGAQGRKPSSNGRSLLSSTPRTVAAIVPRSATKTSTMNSGKRRMQPENPLAQSVPNLSVLRKENTKPSGGSKTARLQVRNYSRSRSNSEEVDPVKEDKPHRSQSLRKNSANPSEFKEMSYMDSDGVALTSIRFDEEILKSIAAKPFLKKGSRTAFDARASIARQKASVELNTSNNVEESEILASGPNDFLNTVNDEVEEQIEILKTEDDKIFDDGKPRLRPELDNFVDSGSENDDSSSFSHVDQALGSRPRNELPSGFLPIKSTEDLPGESPISWNSRGQHPFSYPHEMSDVDISVESPVGSPSWNQMEIDAARMRKKWGTAQKPTLVAHSPNNITRKDRNRGFKRFLKFGRKNHGSENLLDWLSATTSEGDDDTEDGRDLANRSSEDVRKSRMGFSLAQPSDDSFNDSEFFNESVQSSESSIPAIPANFKLREDHLSGSSNKAPRSFFSLSTFRSKGSDSKPR